MTSLLDVVCSMIQQSTRQLPRPLPHQTPQLHQATPSKVPKMAEDDGNQPEDFDVKMKVSEERSLDLLHFHLRMLFSAVAMGQYLSTGGTDLGDD